MPSRSIIKLQSTSAASPAEVRTASPYGTNNARTGTIDFTAPAAATTSQSYTGTVTFSSPNNNLNEDPATLTINFSVPAAVVATDTTPPMIVPTVTGTQGNNGWYVTNAGLTWSVTDAESTISSSTGCGAVTITADQAATTYTCSATSAGGTNSQSVTIKRDATAPVVSCGTSPTFILNQPNTTVSGAYTDALSGPTSATT